MRSRWSFWLIAAVAMLGTGLDSPAALAWEAGWDRYSPADYGPPVHVASPPAVVYPGPLVYAYASGASGAYLSRHAYGRTSDSGYYTTRINVLRGGRWDYSAAYYGSPPVVRVAHARQSRRGGVRRSCPPYRAYIRGPIVRTSRPW
jgi:hypothetical protein